MGRIITTDEQNYIDIAAAIRTQTGETEANWLPSELADGVLAIPSGYKLAMLQLPNTNQLQKVSSLLWGVKNIVGAMVIPVSAPMTQIVPVSKTLLTVNWQGNNYCIYFNSSGVCTKQDDSGLTFDGSTCTIYVPYTFAATTNYIFFYGT